MSFPSIKATKLTVCTADFPTRNLSNHYRLYSDVAWQHTSGLSGASWSIQDPSGVILTQGGSHLFSISLALTAEALALKLSLLVAQASDISQVACYSDCQVLVRLLQSGGHSNELYGIFDDI